MKLDQIIESRAHRNLGRLRSYQKISGADELPIYAKDVSLERDERLIGIYENSLHGSRENIIVTSLGLHILKDTGWRLVRFADIEDIESPSIEQKHVVGEITVKLQNKQTMEVAVKGGEGRFRDAWAFLNFLQRVVADVRKGS